MSSLSLNQVPILETTHKKSGKDTKYRPLEPEQAMSTATYGPFGTETTYKRKFKLIQNGS